MTVGTIVVAFGVTGGVLLGVLDIVALGVANIVGVILTDGLALEVLLGVRVTVGVLLLETVIVGVLVGLILGVFDGVAPIKDFVMEKEEHESLFTKVTLVAEKGISTKIPEIRSIVSTLDKTKLLLS